MKNEAKIPFYLAFQSLRRGRKWTLFLTVLLMAVAFINLVFVSALFNGIIQGSNQQIINTLTSNVYMTPKQGSSSIKNVDELIMDIKKVEDVQAITSSFQIPARIEKDSRSGQWPILAIKPDDYAKVFNIKDKIFEGKYLEDNDTDGIILGRQIVGGKDLELNATSLKGANIGDKIKVIFDNGEKSFTVRGIFYTKFVQSDSRAFVTEKAVSELYPRIINQATSINIKTEAANEESVAKQIQELDSGNETYLWTEAAGLMKSVSSSFVSINALMTTVGAVIAAVTTFIVVYVDVVNRRRQIGILRAVGIKPYIIVINYVILAAVYSILGILLGTLIFYAVLVPYFIAHPFDLPIAEAVLNLKPTEYIIRVEIVSWVAAFSGLLPALLVTKGKMLDAIKGK